MTQELGNAEEPGIEHDHVIRATGGLSSKTFASANPKVTLARRPFQPSHAPSPEPAWRLQRTLAAPQSHTMNSGKRGVVHPYGAYRFLCSLQERDGGPRRAPVRFRVRSENLQERFQSSAWGEWVDRQKMLLNEYRLQPWTPQAQQFLVEQMERFFFGEGSALPSEYVPPSQ